MSMDIYLIWFTCSLVWTQRKAGTLICKMIQTKYIVVLKFFTHCLNWDLSLKPYLLLCEAGWLLPVFLFVFPILLLPLCFKELMTSHVPDLECRSFIRWMTSLKKSWSCPPCKCDPRESWLGSAWLCEYIGSIQVGEALVCWMHFPLTELSICLVIETYLVYYACNLIHGYVCL